MAYFNDDSESSDSDCVGVYCDAGEGDDCAAADDSCVSDFAGDAAFLLSLLLLLLVVGVKIWMSYFCSAASSNDGTG